MRNGGLRRRSLIFARAGFRSTKEKTLKQSSGVSRHPAGEASEKAGEARLVESDVREAICD